MRPGRVSWLACLIVAAGCGDEDGADSPPEKTGAPAAVEVSMRDLRFIPATVRVQSGGTVTWSNHEPVGHDVTKTGGPGPAFTSGVAGGMGEGDIFKQTFTTPGEIEYVCRVHLGMSGTIVVERMPAG